MFQIRWLSDTDGLYPSAGDTLAVTWTSTDGLC